MKRLALFSMIAAISATPVSAGRDDHKPCPATWSKAVAYASTYPPLESNPIPNMKRFNGSGSVVLGFPVAYFLLKTLSESEKRSSGFKEMGSLMIGLQGSGRTVTKALWSANGGICTNMCTWSPQRTASQGNISSMTVIDRLERSIIRCDYSGIN